MSIGYLPKAITKEVLFERAKERFADWQMMFTNPEISADYMYEDMSASCYCGCPADDFPDDFKQEPVKESATSDLFKYRGITFRVTSDETDDKEYIWCEKYNEADDLVDWVWGTLFCGTSWVGSTGCINRLDKFIDAHEKEE